jgi:uncharacterized membrane protein
MTAATQNGTLEKKTTAQPEKDKDTGPVIGRALLYSRLTWVVVGFSYFIAFAALAYLPDIIPVHWNLYGEADGFAGRLPGAFGLSVIITLTAIVLEVLPRFERMRETFNDALDIYTIVVFSTVSMLLVLQVVFLLSSTGMDLPVVIIIPMLLGFFFIMFGSLMPYIGPNTTIGFRLPWTVGDATVWKKTHERGGPVFVISGVLIVLGSPFAGMWATALMLCIFVAATLYITIWSYLQAKAGMDGEGQQCS